MAACVFGVCNGCNVLVTCITPRCEGDGCGGEEEEGEGQGAMERDSRERAGGEGERAGGEGTRGNGKTERGEKREAGLRRKGSNQKG